MDALDSGDEIECLLTLKNSNAEEIIFDDIVWSASISATERSFARFPVTSTTTVDDANAVLSLQFTVPQCSGDWDISLVVDQTPIGGQRFVLWSFDDVRLSGNGA